MNKYFNYKDFKERNKIYKMIKIFNFIFIDVKNKNIIFYFKNEEKYHLHLIKNTHNLLIYKIVKKCVYEW